MSHRTAKDVVVKINIITVRTQNPILQSAARHGTDGITFSVSIKDV
jgi:hypothetical protein